MNKFLKDNLKTKIMRLEVYLCSQCNLRCRYCARYSNFASKWFYDYDKLINDLKHLTAIGVDCITFTGGEPLLYPRFEDLIKELRTFYKGYCNFMSNGKLLQLKADSFYKLLNQNNIDILYSMYKGINYNIIKNRCFRHKVSFIMSTNGLVTNFSNNKYSEPKTEDQNNLEKKLEFCDETCPCLFDGRIYECGRSALINFFNEKSENFKISLESSDSIDIKDLSSKDDFFKFASTPISMCKYCHNIGGQRYKWTNKCGSALDWVEV